MLFLIWLINAAALLLVARLVPGVTVGSFYSALVAALILGLVNVLIRPFVLLLTLPINILTLGVFTLIINALMLWLVSSIVKGFTIADFSTAIVAALVLWIISWLTNAVLNRGSK